MNRKPEIGDLWGCVLRPSRQVEVLGITECKGGNLIQVHHNGRKYSIDGKKFNGRIGGYKFLLAAPSKGKGGADAG
jgi:hypothetical protein